jgi:Domain of unknown function (DUF4126)
MLASLTGLGLSAAAGLNAYIPLLLVGLLARFTGVVELPEPYRWIQSGWALGVVAVLLLAWAGLAVRRAAARRGGRGRRPPPPGGPPPAWSGRWTRSS